MQEFIKSKDAKLTAAATTENEQNTEIKRLQELVKNKDTALVSATTIKNEQDTKIKSLQELVKSKDTKLTAADSEKNKQAAKMKQKDVLNEQTENRFIISTVIACLLGVWLFFAVILDFIKQHWGWILLILGAVIIIVGFITYLVKKYG